MKCRACGYIYDENLHKKEFGEHPSVKSVERVNFYDEDNKPFIKIRFAGFVEHIHPLDIAGKFIEHFYVCPECFTVKLPMRWYDTTDEVFKR